MSLHDNVIRLPFAEREPLRFVRTPATDRLVQAMAAYSEAREEMHRAFVEVAAGGSHRLFSLPAKDELADLPPHIIAAGNALLDEADILGSGLAKPEAVFRVMVLALLADLEAGR